MEIREVEIGSLKPYPKNSKIHDAKQIANVANSIKRFGWQQPLVIDDAGVVVIGHCRLLAAKKLGLKTVPVTVASGLTEDEIRELRIADNKTNESPWDFELLQEDLEGLDFDGFDFDFEIPGEEEEPVEVTEDNWDKPLPEEPRSKLGDIWQLGRHRLMCGDSTDPAVIDRLMDGVKADMVFTDPPYGVSYTGGMKIENGKIESNGREQIKNDSLDYERLYHFLYDTFTNIKMHAKEKSAVYVFYAHSKSREFLNAFHDAGLKRRSVIIWHKTSGGFGDFMAQYMNAYEPCIYGSNGEAVNWYGATNEKTVWDMDKEKKCDLHPTMKPIELVGRAIKNSSKKDDIVLDCFGGSGSTLIACEQLNRTCYMMELDPRYVDVIIDRWETFTGGKAVLLNG